MTLCRIITFRMVSPSLRLMRKLQLLGTLGPHRTLMITSRMLRMRRRMIINRRIWIRMTVTLMMKMIPPPGGVTADYSRRAAPAAGEDTDSSFSADPDFIIPHISDYPPYRDISPDFGFSGFQRSDDFNVAIDDEITSNYVFVPSGVGLLPRFSTRSSAGGGELLQGRRIPVNPKGRAHFKKKGFCGSSFSDSAPQSLLDASSQSNSDLDEFFMQARMAVFESDLPDSRHNTQHSSPTQPASHGWCMKIVDEDFDDSVDSDTSFNSSDRRKRHSEDSLLDLDRPEKRRSNTEMHEEVQSLFSDLEMAWEEGKQQATTSTQLNGFAGIEPDQSPLLSKNYKPSVLFLMETKAVNSTMSAWFQSTGFQNCCIVDPIGSSGGLGLFWIANLTLAVVYQDANVIVTKVTEANGLIWMAIFVYGPPARQERTSFWSSLNGIIQDYCYPSIILGDFKQVTEQEDKHGGRPVSMQETRPIQHFLSANDLEELKHLGCWYTWTNKRQGSDAIFERLDRAFVNKLWFQTFRHAIIRNLPIVSSDHGPILVDIRQKHRPHRKPKFEQFWTACPSSVP
ncbi:OLC1v1000675C1 [Oldenlandia corymbosa var. corymbosa]|uniref:OLC1v1000675C1 n=1 Tax=Oldenlandia corymbosa var. corymbosa TaxID=529605 RepID=A0AAV1D3T6_OLDCO|nr:OLC1v1000675C1 [Oldenlandia corymbosa var. corymbosa]